MCAADSFDASIEIVSNLLTSIETDLKAKAWAKLEESVVTVESLDDVAPAVADEKVVQFYWCGDEECGQAIEEETDVDVLGIREENIDTDKVCPHCGKPAKHLALMAKTY